MFGPFGQVQLHSAAVDEAVAFGPRILASLEPDELMPVAVS